MASGPYGRVAGVNDLGEFPDIVATQLSQPGDWKTPPPFVASVSGAFTLDATQRMQSLTVTGATTFSLPTPPAGLTTLLTVYVTQDATGAWVLTWPSAASAVPVFWTGGAVPNWATTAGTRGVVFFEGSTTLGWQGYDGGVRA